VSSWCSCESQGGAKLTSDPTSPHPFVIVLFIFLFVPLLSATSTRTVHISTPLQLYFIRQLARDSTFLICNGTTYPLESYTWSTSYRLRHINYNTKMSVFAKEAFQMSAMPSPVESRRASPGPHGAVTPAMEPSETPHIAEIDVESVLFDVSELEI
jgi:hypothetical protein